MIIMDSIKSSNELFCEFTKLLRDNITEYPNLLMYDISCSCDVQDDKLIVNAFNGKINALVEIDDFVKKYTEAGTYSSELNTLVIQILDSLSKNVNYRQKEAVRKLFEKSLLATVKFMAICLLWSLLEIRFYGHVETRAADNIIGMLLFYYIAKSELS